jgi:hypothetical protein
MFSATFQKILEAQTVQVEETPENTTVDAI